MSTSKSSSKLLYKLDDNPGFVKSVLLGIQHIILVFGGSVLMPVIICRSTGTSIEQTEYIIFATTIITAVSSFIQIKRFGKVGAGYLLFMGSSGAYWGAVAAAVNLKGWDLVAVLSIASAPIELLVSYFYRHLRKIITPLVGGVVIMIISISLLPIMMELWTGKADSADYCSPQRLLIGGATLLITLVIAFSRNGKLRIWSILIGIGSGIVLSLLMGYMDFSPINEQKWVGLPRGHWPGFSFDFSGQAFSLLAIFMIATLASSIESIGDAISVQKVSNPNFKKIDYESVQGCLNSDGLSNMLAGAVGTVPNTTYSGNIAAIEITGVASRKVGYYAAAILLLIAFFPKIAYFVAYIPDPVLGGANILFMSMLLNVGMQLINEEAANYKTSLIVSVSLAAGLLSSMGMIFPSLFSDAGNMFFTNGIAVGGIVAILMNGFLILLRKKPEKIILPREEESVTKLVHWINKIGSKKGIDKAMLMRANLVCEELFVYMKENTHHKAKGITFRMRYEEDEIHIDISDKAKIEDMDGEVDKDEVIKESPDKLGLVLVQKLTKEFEHQRISGYNYIHLKLAAFYEFE